MKRVLLVLLCVVALQAAHAQERKSGQWMAKASGGLGSNQQDYFLEFGLGKYFGTSPSSLQLSFMFVGRDNSSMWDDDNKYRMLLLYGYAIELPRSWSLTLQGGGFVGWGAHYMMGSGCEFSNLNVNYSGYAGLALAVQVDYQLSKRWGLYVQPTFMNDMTNKNTWFLGGLGAKYYF